MWLLFESEEEVELFDFVGFYDYCCGVEGLVVVISECLGFSF